MKLEHLHENSSNIMLDCYLHVFHAEHAWVEENNVEYYSELMLGLSSPQKGPLTLIYSPFDVYRHGAGTGPLDAGGATPFTSIPFDTFNKMNPMKRVVALTYVIEKAEKRHRLPAILHHVGPIIVSAGSFESISPQKWAESYVQADSALTQTLSALVEELNI